MIFLLVIVGALFSFTCMSRTLTILTELTDELRLSGVQAAAKVVVGQLGEARIRSYADRLADSIYQDYVATEDLPGPDRIVGPKVHEQLRKMAARFAADVIEAAR